ncbi:MAG TPA: potassium/proton antiporter [Euzebya sp.]|nr:potassium/proton antiporter [Euzebya sp.]
MSLHLPADGLILGIAALLALGVVGAGLSNRLRVPGLLLFLVLGMLIADDGLGLISMDNPLVAQAVGTIALVAILFEGGLTTKPRDFRIAAVPGLVLATVGVVTTAALVAVTSWLLFDIRVVTALLIGAVVASTDAAAVFAVLRRAPLPRRLTSLLEVESGANDPMAIILTIGALETLDRSPALSEWVVFAVMQLGGGVLVGAGVAWVGSEILNRARLGAAGLYPILATSIAGLAYGLAAAAGASGFLAVYVAGLIVGAKVPRHRRAIRTFHDGLASAAGIGLFLMLGILVFPSDLPGVALEALAVTAVLVFIARPIAVLLCLVWFGYSWQDLVLISWAGLRGAVPIVLATFPLAAGFGNGQAIFNVVFFTVLVSAALQGLSVGWLARRLGLAQAGRVWAPVAEVLPLEDAEGIETELVEITITDQLHVAGKQLRQVPLPGGGLATTLMRDDRVLVPGGTTVLQAGDVLLVVMPEREGAAERLVAWARGEAGPKVRSA